MSVPANVLGDLRELYDERMVVRCQFGDDFFDQSAVVHLELLLHAALIRVFEDVERAATQAFATG